MDYIIWACIIVCFVIGFLGLIFPILPSIVMFWVAYCLYGFYFTWDEFGFIFWSVNVILTIWVFLSDYYMNAKFLQKYEAQPWTTRLGTVALIVGGFVIPPWGLILVPFIVVLLVEWALTKQLKKATVLSFATVASFLSSTVAKFVAQVIMVISFILAI